MTSTEFGILRRMELIAWMKARHPKNWQSRMTREISRDKDLMTKFLSCTATGKVAFEVEYKCRQLGFVSRYDSLFAEYEHHRILLREFITVAAGESGSGIEFDTGRVRRLADAEQLIFALGFTTPPTQKAPGT